MMKIASSDVAMASTYRYQERETETESLRAWVGNENGAQQQGGIGQLASGMAQDLLQISEEAKSLLAEQLRVTAPSKEDPANGLSDKESMQIRLIEDFIANLTGKKIKIVVFDPSEMKKAASASLQEAVSAAYAERRAQHGQGRVGWGVAYDYNRTYSEQEQMNFAAAGTVKTADGREINFQLDYSLSRSYYEQESIRYRAGDAKIDPLVVNFGGAPAQLTKDKVSFDLNADGQQEKVSFVGPGSGFLALDKNGDGKINDGTELFGPQSGNGFAELAKYDSDANGWIDENDPIYEKLKLWVKDEKGNDQLLALGQKGIGAIYLGNIDTQFAMKNPANQLQGEVKSSGVFLRENGTAGIVQQIDLAI